MLIRAGGVRAASTVAARTRGLRGAFAHPASRWLLGAFFVAAGINHFVMPRGYERIVPPGLGNPSTLVAVSGVAEVAGGVGVLIGGTRRWAGWGLLALLVAVFPANVYMALDPSSIPGLRVPRVLLWLRLPLQPLAMWWAWAATQPHKRRSRSSASSNPNGSCSSAPRP